jgi:hypothetical protein
MQRGVATTAAAASFWDAAAGGGGGGSAVSLGPKDNSINSLQLLVG